MDLKILENTPPWDWPKDAGKTIRKALTNTRGDMENRILAAEMAGELVAMHDGLADALVAIVRSSVEPEELRARAAISLGPVLEDGDTMGFDDPDDVPITLATFHKIQTALHEVYLNESTPKEVRRRVLEASVRAPEDWHRSAIQAAYSSGDREWQLTAVFAMRWVRGFETQIMDALNSKDPEIHFEAVNAAGNSEIAAAWPHVAALVTDENTPKQLLIAAIGAIAGIRPSEAVLLLADLATSDDEDIAEAADEAIMMAEGAQMSDEEDEGEEPDKWVN